MPCLVTVYTSVRSRHSTHLQEVMDDNRFELKTHNRQKIQMMKSTFAKLVFNFSERFVVFKLKFCAYYSVVRGEIQCWKRCARNECSGPCVIP